VNEEAVADIRSRLEAIGEELADLGLELLREALAQGGESLEVAARQRRLASARRSVLKAAGLLGGSGAA